MIEMKMKDELADVLAFSFYSVEGRVYRTNSLGGRTTDLLESKERISCYYGWNQGRIQSIDKNFMDVSSC
jgi:hypothetical protein